ncbi:MAG: hypothetical protein R8J94_14735 [Acidimicrobiia bacterium]|nr:hypothetical protein [Acidimicrobiia bacterium]
MKHVTSSWHTLLPAAAVAMALLFGWAQSWALALALLGCGVMLGTVFWLGRSAAHHVPDRAADRDELLEHR